MSNRSNKDNSKDISHARGTDNNQLQDTLQAILYRLNALEDQNSASRTRSITPPLPQVEVNSEASGSDPTTIRILDAIGSINSVRSTHIYISNFDPSVHNFEVWCNEVDHIRALYKWDDRECLSRIGNCLKGSARTWLDEWVSTDRCWSTFKRDFKTLCPKTIDIAGILFDIMKTDSDNFLTYAEYASKSLLRLRSINGLSEKLISAIIIRGIKDPQIRASATNAKLEPHELVNFFSNYTKAPSDRNTQSRTQKNFTIQRNFRKREQSGSEQKVKCFGCGNFGHKQNECYKLPKASNEVTFQKKIIIKRK